jgi:hypothetical protein
MAARGEEVLVLRTLLVTSTALLVAGCGSDPSSFEGSSEELKDAGTSRIEFRLEENSVEWPFSVAGVGTIDYAKERGDLVVAVERQKSKDSPSMEMRTVYIGRDTYLVMPYRGKTLWKKNPDYEATGPDRFAPGPGGARPDEVLDLLVKSSKTVEHLGNDEIRGVSADHYRAHIDEKAVGDDYEPKGLVIDAWIDDDGLLRRIRTPFGGTDGPVEVIDLYDFGVPVEIEAPPADEVISEEEFNKLMERECENSDVARDENAWCLLFGSDVSRSGGSVEISPTETMPRRVEEKR